MFYRNIPMPFCQPISELFDHARADAELQAGTNTNLSSEIPSEKNQLIYHLLIDEDKKKREQPRNRLPVRAQSLQKQEVRKRIDIILNLNIIEKSNASYYSQVMMTPKKDGAWLFCADYRNMNGCTEQASWPLGEGDEIVARIGSHKPNLFAVMDLTTGYRQAAMSLAARLYPDFETYTGIYQFKPLPFGPERAPSYFQEMMASTLLNGLIYFVREMYIDDCILHAKENKEFLERLEILSIVFKTKILFKCIQM
jgi:hypothetical protein